MACCEDFPIDDIYVPLSRRLVDYGKEVYGETLLKSYPYTHMWIFTFYKDSDLCVDCEQKFAEMAKWFNDYGLFQDAMKNVKWVVDDDIDNNMILKDMAVHKTPMHLFCDKEGKIIDLVYGFPSIEWLKKYILPYINN
jgi:hypothetical protein